MKPILTLIIAAMLTAPVAAAPAADIIERADSAYAADNFKEAVELYSQAIDSLGTSSELYYNLGNAYYRLGSNGLAIVNYERALRLNPTNSDARENLEFVNTKITDRVGDRGSFLSNSFDKIVALAHPDTWAIIGITAFALMLAGGLLYVFASSVLLRKFGFFGALALLLLSVAANILARAGSRHAVSHTTAIVIEPSTILSTSPRMPKDRTEEAFLLHEGTKIEILDSVSVPTDTTGAKWYEVSVDNTHRAWISSRSIEKI